MIIIDDFFHSFIISLVKLSPSFYMQTYSVGSFVLEVITFVVKMANRSFNNGFLFVVYVFALLDVVLLQGPPAPQSVSYYKESSDGVAGIRIAFDATKDKAMNIIISYDTVVVDSSIPFFTKQLNDKTFAAFSQCDSIAWTFLPCSTSKMDGGGQLACALGKDQCTYDKVHACVATSLKNDQKKLGNFIICSFAGITTQQCALNNQLEQRKIELCVNYGEGAKECDAFHKQISDAKTKRTNAELEAGKTQDATIDFTHVVCSYLGQANLKCDSGCNVPHSPP